MLRLLVTSALFLLFSLSSGCATGPRAASQRPGGSDRASAPSPDEFTLVFLRAGSNPAPLLVPDLESTLTAHDEFMGRLEADGKLLLAGQFRNTQATNDLRGLLIVEDDGSPSRASFLDGDPAAQLGIFRHDAVPLLAPRVIRKLPQLSAAFGHGAGAAQQDGLGPVLADYVVLVAAGGAQAFEACTHEALAGKVLLLGRLGGDRDGALFGVFDAEDPGEVRARFLVAGHSGDGLELNRCLATPALRELFESD